MYEQAYRHGVPDAPLAEVGSTESSGTSVRFTPSADTFTNIEFHLLDTGHFALEEYGPMMAKEILEFLDRETPQG